jgi:hypothetical protein
VITALCRIGFEELALGYGAEAREHLAEALERAHHAQAVSLELLALRVSAPDSPKILPNRSAPP